MKIYNKGYVVTIILMIFISTGCKDFLEEESISNQTTDGYYVDEAGFEDLIRSNYTLLRDIHQARDLVMLGTDMFTQGGWSEVGNGSQGNPLNTYDIRMNSAMGSLATLWDLLVF